MPKSKNQIVQVDGKELTIKNLEKVLYPATGFTKGQVIDYYVKIGPVILPHLQNRPLTLKRYPNGVDAGFFYEKECPSYHPEWIETISVPSTRRAFVHFCVVNDLASLIWVVNLASLEMHTSLSYKDDVLTPTMMVFDLDPGPPADLLDCLDIAFQLKAIFDELGLEVFPKTSGGKGLHVYAPLNTKTDYDKTKSFAKAVAQLLEKKNPDKVTSNMRKDLRKGKIFVDWSQNDDHKTTVCVYSLRARERPTVSAPVTWERLQWAAKHKDTSKIVMETADILRQVEKEGDLYAPMLTLKQTLPKL